LLIATLVEKQCTRPLNEMLEEGKAQSH